MLQKQDDPALSALPPLQRTALWGRASMFLEIAEAIACSRGNRTFVLFEDTRKTFLDLASRAAYYARLQGTFVYVFRRDGKETDPNVRSLLYEHAEECRGDDLLDSNPYLLFMHVEKCLAGDFSSEIRTSGLQRLRDRADVLRQLKHGEVPPRELTEQLTDLQEWAYQAGELLLRQEEIKDWVTES